MHKMKYPICIKNTSINISSWLVYDLKKDSKVVLFVTINAAGFNQKLHRPAVLNF